MRIKCWFIAFLFLLPLVGCESNNEFISNMFSKKEGQLEIYIIYSDHNQRDNSSLNDDVMNHLYEHVYNNVTITTMHSQTERIVEVFNIEEFPTILVFDHKNLLLQTTSLEKFKEFTSRYYDSMRSSFQTN